MSSRGRCLPAAVLRTSGILLLLLVAVFCIPLTVPRFFGYQIYSVVSGSMEPAIPTGSLVYIREEEPGEVAEGDVIAFCGASHGASIITHRVVENRVVMGDFITRGDANQSPDMNPVSYARLIGKVEHSIPKAGRIADVFTSSRGKMLAGCAVAASVLLQAAASLVEGRAQKRRK